MSALPNTNINLDDHVEGEIADCLNLASPRSFFLFAGAGSGKTKSLVNALQHIQSTQAANLYLNGQRVGVITYTNAARDEIISRMKADPIFEVSTIHSFAWSLIKGFDKDIRAWIEEKLKADIADLEAQETKGRKGTKTSVARVAQIESKQRRLARLETIKKFIYSPTGDNRERNALNHAEVIGICSSFLEQKPLLQKILVNQYPFLLIDEGQDTNKHLVDSLLKTEIANKGRFSLGIIGDTMQRIYNDGKEKIEGALPDSWAKPKKVLNHRCPKRVLTLINKIRSDVDRVMQEPRSDSAEGYVRLFILPDTTADKARAERAVRDAMAQHSGDDEWKVRDSCKILTLEHHMAARRMGFSDVFDPLYAVDDFRTGLLDGSLPALKFFTNDILETVTAWHAGDKFRLAKVVRAASPLLTADRLEMSTDQRKQLRAANDAVEALLSLWTNEKEPTCWDVLQAVAESELFAIPEALRPLLRIRSEKLEIEKVESEAAAEQAHSESPEADGDETELSERISNLERFLQAPFTQIQAYRQYVSGIAPFDTHQGVKGLEFPRVMVVMDDTEARGFLFGYGKLFGAKSKTDADLKNEREGKDTSIDRTRRLFYVTCSRAKEGLALVLYTDAAEAVRQHVLQNNWFSDEEIQIGVE